MRNDVLMVQCNQRLHHVVSGRLSMHKQLRGSASTVGVFAFCSDCDSHMCDTQSLPSRAGYSRRKLLAGGFFALQDFALGKHSHHKSLVWWWLPRPATGHAKRMCLLRGSAHAFVWSSYCLVVARYCESPIVVLGFSSLIERHAST